MSASEHHARMEALEQNPELLREIESAGKETGSNADTPQHAETDAESESISEAPTLDDWPNPLPLGGELPPVLAFDSQLLPAALQPLTEDTAERMQVPLDYPAVVAVLCVAGVTGRRATIQPKVEDTSWVITPNLWGGIIAPPGLMKSAVISQVTLPLREIEALWRAEHESAVSSYEQQKEEMELRQSALEGPVQKCAKKRQSCADPP